MTTDDPTREPDCSHRQELQIGASVLAADPVRLEEEIATVSAVDFLHVDLFDDHFVSGVSWGQGTLERIVEISDLPVEAHLMVESPKKWAEMAVSAGCTRIIFHVEAANNPAEVAQHIKNLGVEVGLAISPDTPLGDLDECLPIVESVLVMTVQPGEGGSDMVETAPSRVNTLRTLIQNRGHVVQIEVDGGVNLQTGRRLVEAGATRMVVGTGLFEAQNRDTRVRELRTAFSM